MGVDEVDGVIEWFRDCYLEISGNDGFLLEKEKIKGNAQ